MNFAIHSAARLALASGVVACAWLMPAGPTPGAATAAEPGLVRLAQADAGGSPVSYTAEQAEKGEKRFKSDCVECHGDDLKGGMNGGPPLRGLSFEQKFADGAPASALFGFMSTLMPPNSPGRFSPATYADLMAYILKRNGFKEGAPLPSDLDALDNLIMQK
jgi:mono/diheme cytochrome c family protein